MLGDSIAWGGCTVIYLLGQQLHFELFDFSYQVLNVAEVEAASITQPNKNAPISQVYEFSLDLLPFPLILLLSELQPHFIALCQHLLFAL